MASRSNNTQQVTVEMKRQMEENLNGKNPFLYISALPGFHQPFRSPENWERSVASIKSLWEGMGVPSDVSFRRLRNGLVACFIQFEEGSLNEAVVEALREEGEFVIEGPLRVRRDWDYSKGEPKTSWDYNVSVSRYPFLNAEQRKARHQAKKKPKFIFKKKKKTPPKIAKKNIYLQQPVSDDEDES